MEGLNSKKFKTLEKDELKQIYGGAVQYTYAWIRTFVPYDGEKLDVSVADDTPPGPILT